MPVASMFSGVPSHFPFLQRLDILLEHSAGQFIHQNRMIGELILINSSMHTQPATRLKHLTITGLTLFPYFPTWTDSTASTLESLASLGLHFTCKENFQTVDAYSLWAERDGGLVSATTITRLPHR